MPVSSSDAGSGSARASGCCCLVEAAAAVLKWCLRKKSSSSGVSAQGSRLQRDTAVCVSSNHGHSWATACSLRGTPDAEPTKPHWQPLSFRGWGLPQHGTALGPEIDNLAPIKTLKYTEQQSRCIIRASVYREKVKIPPARISDTNSEFYEELNAVPALLHTMVGLDRS
jgi:hypothetical protein